MDQKDWNFFGFGQFIFYLLKNLYTIEIDKALLNLVI